VADSYVSAASQSARSVAQQAADRKCQNYGELSAAYEFQPAAVEKHGPMDDSTAWFFTLTWVAKFLNVRVTRLIDGHFYFNGPVC